MCSAQECAAFELPLDLRIPSAGSPRPFVAHVQRAVWRLNMCGTEGTARCRGELGHYL